ncbi:MAG: lipoprotein N-acyltransferase Lnb domain-containing protein [Rhodanobacter sp.]
MIFSCQQTRHFRLYALLLALLLAILPSARASVANAPGANIEVSLITYGPGETYWERFGHDAIELRDTVSGEAVNFNYGVFDFSEKNFFLNFARGRMHYLMDAAPSDLDESYYVGAGRSVTRQQLALTAGQAAALRDFLLWNLRPENAGYNYDYYADNCTTRVRDALDKALGGVIGTQLKARAGGMTYRQQTARLMSAQPWLMLLMDLGLGPYADRPLSAWQESFLPEVLQAQLREVRVDDGHGGLRPLLQTEQLVSANRLDVPPAAAPDLRLPLALAGLLLAALIVLARRRWPAGYALLGNAYLLGAGLTGLLLLALWTLTTHYSAWANANLLLFNPFAFALLPTLWRSRRGLAASRFIDGVIALQLLACMAAVLLHLLPGTVQQNQPWLMFALPCWLALAWSLRRHR